MDVDIRAEQPQDFDQIARVVEAAFGSAAEARLVEFIRSSPNYEPSLALVGVLGDVVVGHTMLSRVAIEDGTTRHEVLSLSPLAVAPAEQNRGIGRALVRRALELADEMNEPLVLVEGSPRYYGALGFEDAREHGITFPLPDWAPPNAGQLHRLSRYDASIRGRIMYPEPFAMIEQLRDA